MKYTDVILALILVGLLADFGFNRDLVGTYLGNFVRAYHEAAQSPRGKF